MYRVAFGLLAACGRFGFDGPHADARDDAALDTTVDAPSSLIHDYPLDNSLADLLGGPGLEALGGLFGAQGYQFTANSGLRLNNAIPALEYSIELTFQFEAVTGYRKVIDFKARNTDGGLYVEDGFLQFVVNPVTGCPNPGDCFTSSTPLFVSGNQLKLLVTRDAAGTIRCVIDDTPLFVFSDGSDVGAFDTAQNTGFFFVDDGVTTNEASAGIVRRIRIFSAAI